MWQFYCFACLLCRQWKYTRNIKILHCVAYYFKCVLKVFIYKADFQYLISLLILWAWNISWVNSDILLIRASLYSQEPNLTYGHVFTYLLSKINFLPIFLVLRLVMTWHFKNQGWEWMFIDTSCFCSHAILTWLIILISMSLVLLTDILS